MGQTQQAESRKDPKPRRRGRGQDGQVKNRQPDRAYIMANPAESRFGLAKKLEEGWTKVNHKGGDKERVFCGKLEENGDVTFEGQVLLWISKDEHEAMLADAHDIVVARDAQAKQPGGIDGVRSADGRLAQNYPT
jgi:hypothetical protein